MPIPSVKQMQALKESRCILSSLIAASANGTSPEAEDVVMTIVAARVRSRVP